MPEGGGGRRGPVVSSRRLGRASDDSKELDLLLEVIGSQERVTG